MLLTLKNLDSFFCTVQDSPFLALDTETYGLRIEDMPFSIIIATKEQAWYIDLRQLCSAEVLPEVAYRLFSTSSIKWFMHNAKFDLHKLLNLGYSIAGPVYDTEIMMRLVRNDLLSYKLASCVKHMNLECEKDNAVEDYIAKNKLYTMESVPNKKTRFKNKHYDQVPLEIMQKYAENDAIITNKLGVACWDEIHTAQDAIKVLHNEEALTKVCLKMERIGVQIDENYTKESLAYEERELAKEIENFKGLCGKEFDNKRSTLQSAFEEVGLEYGTTEKGNPCFNHSALSKLEGEVPKSIEAIRNRQKNIGTYFSSFLFYQDSANCIHPNMRQCGTETGRFSYTNPNLQNIPKEDTGCGSNGEGVRRCFIPRSDYTFFFLDYDQQEFRLMLDYAGQKDLIESINGGLDVHQATADMLGITRKEAKTLNFGLLYGMGVRKLAAALKVTEAEAHALRAKYFAKLPKVNEFLRAVIQRGEMRGYVKNWFGRRCFIKYKSDAYKLPNHIIQGGGADIIKNAMVRIDALFTERNLKSRMVLQVHDELIFEIHKDEEGIVPEIRRIMEDVYVPFNGMKLTVGVERSSKSWAAQDKEEV